MSVSHVDIVTDDSKNLAYKRHTGQISWISKANLFPFENFHPRSPSENRGQQALASPGRNYLVFFRLSYVGCSPLLIRRLSSALHTPELTS